MKPSRRKAPAPALPVPQSDDDARAAVREVGELARAIARIEADMNDAIAELQQAAGDGAAPLRARLDAVQKGLQIYCTAHRDRLTGGGKVKHHRFATGLVAWRVRPPRVTIRGLDEVIARIKALGHAARFLRVKEAVDKEAMLAAPEIAAAIDGVTIGSGGEDFVVEPYETDAAEGA